MLAILALQQLECPILCTIPHLHMYEVFHWVFSFPWDWQTEKFDLGYLKFILRLFDLLYLPSQLFIIFYQR